ncbi:MAG: type I restriction-modification system subunit M N-terminal domain-containing protein [Ideonella sp. WA131b]|jgi:hypothetical protein|nr:type I restriction-modification system subunit M N-terminal domain-containing protein [Ideonella sp. WA131b]
MFTGELRSQVDAIWNAFWTGGSSNPMEVIEQITCLLFIRRLDDAHSLGQAHAHHGYLFANARATRVKAWAGGRPEPGGRRIQCKDIR